MMKTKYKVVIGIICLFMLADTLLTLYGVGYKGYEETNPLMAYLFYTHGIIGFILFHSLTLLLIPAMLYFADYLLTKNKDRLRGIFDFILLFGLCLSILPVANNIYQLVI